MQLELRHLRSLQALAGSETLAQAAARLHLTPSALSHQIKALEDWFETPLLLRGVRPLGLTPAGQRLLTLAGQVLPAVEEATDAVRKMARGDCGRLYITIECHACFEWLLPTLEHFRQDWPQVEVDIRLGVSFDPLPALLRGEVDLVITSDPVDTPPITFEPLFSYQALLVLAHDHPLATRRYITPRDLAGETLITYPVERRRLDVFTRFLQPASIEPRAVRQTELTTMMLQLITIGRGVAVLPDWVLQAHSERPRLATRPLGRDGLFGTLYAALRRNETGAAYINDFLKLARRREAAS